MTLRILIDDSIIIEYVGERQPYCACWNKLNALQLVGYAELWTTPDAYRNMDNRLHGVLPDEVIGAALSATLDFVEVCSIDADDVRYALSHCACYEDALIDICARKIRAEYIVSRRSFDNFDAKAFICTPEELFDHLGQTRSLTFDLVDI